MSMAGAVVLDEPAAAAYAYAALVDVTLLEQNIPVSIGPLIEAENLLPPGPVPVTNSLISIGPIPGDGSLVEHAGVLESTAATQEDPAAQATAEVAGVKLLNNGTSAAITADVVKAQANADCETAPNGNGTTFVNLTINGTPIDATPAPNTVIDLTIAKVILNEQHPAADGRGFVVNALHLISTETGDALFRGDVIISHAVATVNCPEGPGSTGGTNVVKLSKSASPTTVGIGDTVTYTATVTNDSTSNCITNKLTEHLAPPFDLVSTSGAFGSSASQEPRSGGGTDVILGNGTVVPAGQSKTQTFVVKVRTDAAPGVWFNDLEILCADLGNFVMGLDAPVAVLGASSTATPTATSTATSSPGPGGGGGASESPSPGATTRVLGNRLARTGLDPDGLARLALLANMGGTSIGIGALFRRKGKPV
jgi:uncharacterized repeat protein (TIGR01451 family)